MNQPRATLAAGMQVTPSVRLLEPLGAGGMGAVWLADNTALKTRVVVKFMLGGLDSSASARARFTREAEAAAQVKSPHVVQMFDHGVTSEGVPFIVMEHLEGRDLGAEIAERGALPPTQVIQIVTQVAKALGKVHAAGLLHRDIKPDNIFLVATDADEDLFVKLLDFGIAKSHAPDAEPTSLDGQTKTGQVVGTPFYMSPEQVTAQKVIDLRSDLWALGVVAFEALTGQRPFDGPSFGALAVKIATGVPYKPTELNASLPQTVDKWFSQACARDPKDRFASARELADRLRAAFDGVVSLPPVASGMSDSGPRARSASGPETAEREIASADTAVDVRAAASTPRPVDGGGPVSVGAEASERPSFVLASTVQERETSDPSALARSEPGGAAVAIRGEQGADASTPRKGPPRGAIVATLGLVIAVGVAGIAIGRRSNEGDVERTPSAARSEPSGETPIVPATTATTATTATATATESASADADASAAAPVVSVSVSTSASAPRTVRVTKPPVTAATAAKSAAPPPASAGPPSTKPATPKNDDPLF